MRQITELIHEEELRQKSMTRVRKLRRVPQPRGQLLAAGGGDFVDDASGPALRGGAARAQQPVFLQALQGGIYLAEFGGPEMADAVIQDSFQVVSTGRLAQQAQQNMFETHPTTI